jgi:hypothetical protein
MRHLNRHSNWSFQSCSYSRPKDWWAVSTSAMHPLLLVRPSPFDRPYFGVSAFGSTWRTKVTFYSLWICMEVPSAKFSLSLPARAVSGHQPNPRVFWAGDGPEAELLTSVIANSDKSVCNLHQARNGTGMPASSAPAGDRKAIMLLVGTSRLDALQCGKRDFRNRMQGDADSRQ